MMIDPHGIAFNNIKVKKSLTHLEDLDSDSDVEKASPKVL